jgi:hypothetical protein
MAMTEKLEPSIVHEVLLAEKPGTVQQLANGIRGRTNATLSEIVALLRVMTRSGELKVKQELRAPSPSLYRAFVHMPRPFKVLLLLYKNETVIKALFFVLVFNAISWIIIIAFQTSVMLAPFRIIFHGVNLLFLPGFAMTILWYPFPSARLDFTRLDRRSNVRDGRIVKDKNRAKVLDPLTRVAYSICYSIGLVILAGFFIGLLGYGFDINIMLSLLTAIEMDVVVAVIIKIQKLRDPYFNI